MKARQLVRFATALLSALIMAGCTTQGDKGTQAQFVGSDACAGCHQAAYQSWKGTLHSRMVLPLREGLLKDAGDKWASDGKNAGPTKGNIDGNMYKLDDVVYVVGTKWKQRYLVKNTITGNHQFMDKQWNRYTRLWEPYGQANDWETQCATCHTTGYRVLAQDEKNGAVTKSAYSERNVGCEACHGPGSLHAASGNKAQIFNPKNASAAEASKVCGYCHIRSENYQIRTAQGRASEHMPNPVLGESYKAGKDDWTRWYPDKLLAPGVHPEDTLTAENKGTDLFNAFWQDAQSTSSGLYDARKHHQEYQEYLQSKHAKAGVGCSTCHTSHAARTTAATPARASCVNCHGQQYDWQKVMPGTAQTAGQLFVRTHTFNPKQARAGGMTADKLPPPEFFYRK